METSEHIGYLKEMIQEKKVKRVEKEDRASFEEFKYCNSFADSTHSLLWAWGEEFYYSYKKISDTLLIAGIGLDAKLSFYLVKKDGAELKEALDYLLGLSTQYHFPVILDNIPEEYLEEIKAYFAQKEKKITITFELGLSDYVYETDDFLELSGKRNRHKREDKNHFERNFGDFYYVPYQEKLKDHLHQVFDSWCDNYQCSRCVFGCEKRAFERLMELYGTKDLQCGMIYDKKEPVSFAIAEKINDDTMSYYMQKNKLRIRGLTYYLNSKMIVEKTAEYINLGEDMSLPGLRMEKTGYRPVFLKHKYRIEMEER